MGKTTLAREVISTLNLKTLSVNGDETRFIDILSSRDLFKIKELVAGYQMLFVDEAQRIPEIGLALKIIIDQIPGLKVLVTGSSSLDLASSISEPLTGRVWTYHLYPISFSELSGIQNTPELDYSLEDRLIYGSYPEIFSIEGYTQKREYLDNLANAYLYKDLISFGGIKSPVVVRDLLKLLAFQVGSQVALSELSGALRIGWETVSKYIDLLEKSYIIFRVSGFSRNLRKEIDKMDKIYFYDLGVRNVLIDNFKPLKDRQDPGALWENFLILERIKMLAYKQILASTYYWRTYTGAELDWVEEREGNLYGFEFKSGSKWCRPPKTWLESYEGSEFECINRSNYLKFILPNN